MIQAPRCDWSLACPSCFSRPSYPSSARRFRGIRRCLVVHALANAAMHDTVGRGDRLPGMCSSCLPLVPQRDLPPIDTLLSNAPLPLMPILPASPMFILPILSLSLLSLSFLSSLYYLTTAAMASASSCDSSTRTHTLVDLLRQHLYPRDRLKSWSNSQGERASSSSSCSPM